MRQTFCAVLVLLGAYSTPAFSEMLGRQTERIAVDQFGYLPSMDKVAVISNPIEGADNADKYQPGAMLEVRRITDNAVMFSAAPIVWHGGAVDPSSGNQAWWFDFSSVRCEGEYYIYDPVNDAHSFKFAVKSSVYSDVLRQAMRMYFYQRCAQDKQPPNAEPRWADGPSHLQDRQTRFLGTPDDPTTAKDVSGGWYDAGDYNKYVTWAGATLENLLFAYQYAPAVWTDDTGIPESGNGVPDVLDEINWELAWLRRMQQVDGSVLSKVATRDVQGKSPASADDGPRYYSGASTSASFTAAMSFAHAALIEKTALPALSQELESAAVSAWRWAEANPNVKASNEGFPSPDPELSDYDRAMRRMAAAVHLYALTGAAEFKSVVESGYQTAHAIEQGHWSGFESTIQDALLYYTTLVGVDTAIATAIRDSLRQSMSGDQFLGAVLSQNDPYRAYLADYVWGSNWTKGSVGLLFASKLRIDPLPTLDEFVRQGETGYLHYLHGVNPQSIVYLTNMYGQGATKSVDEMYHWWMGDGTDWDNAKTSLRGPAPGYLVGGPNASYYSDTVLQISPPAGQPPQKSYKDWNSNYPENSWQISEPAIYYQAAYVRLLAEAIADGAGRAGANTACMQTSVSCASIAR